jgi:hypothetical protein
LLPGSHLPSYEDSAPTTAHAHGDAEEQLADIGRDWLDLRPIEL